MRSLLIRLTVLVCSLATAGLVATGSATAAPAAPAPSDASAPYRTATFHPQQGDMPTLMRHWRTWRSETPYRYTTEVTSHCFCAQRPAVRTVVHGKRVTSVTYAGHRRQLARHGYEVSRLYLLLRRAYAHADRVSVHWSSRGVPRSIYIDWDRRVADEETSLSVVVHGRSPHVACPLVAQGPCSGPPHA